MPLACHRTRICIWLMAPFEVKPELVDMHTQLTDTASVVDQVSV